MTQNGNNMSPPRTTSVQPNYLADQVLSALQDAIRKKIYAPGERLPSESRLATEYNVSRSTIREALRVLSHLGLVETWAGKGSFVSENQPPEPQIKGAITVSEIKDIYDFRYALEIEAAERAALKRTSGQLQQMKDLLNGTKTAIARGNTEATAISDTDFHITILEAGDCHFAASVYRAHRPRIEQAARAVIEITGPPSSERSLSSVQSIHDDLIDAIERQDAHAALVSVRRDQRELDALLRLQMDRKA